MNLLNRAYPTPVFCTCQYTEPSIPFSNAAEEIGTKLNLWETLKMMA